MTVCQSRSWNEQAFNQRRVGDPSFPGDHPKAPESASVVMVSTAPLTAALSAGTPILSALATMTQRRMRHLPVVESGQIRGIVSIGDLVKYRIERIEAEAEALRTYIQSA